MALKDDIKRERKAYFATATLKQKIEYIVHYYAPTALLIIAIIAFILYFILDAIHQPKNVLNGTFINLYTYDTRDEANELANKYLNDKGIDTTKYTATFGSNLVMSSDLSVTQQSDQALIAQVSAGILDFTIGSSNHLLPYAYEQIFADLTTVLSEEQIEKYEPYFLYIDRTIILEKENTSLDDLDGIEYPDCTKPEEMKDPIPVFIMTTESDIINDLYGFNDPHRCIGIVYNGKNQKNAIDFLDYIMK